MIINRLILGKWVPPGVLVPKTTQLDPVRLAASVLMFLLALLLPLATAAAVLVFQNDKPGIRYQQYRFVGAVAISKLIQDLQRSAPSLCLLGESQSAIWLPF